MPKQSTNHKFSFKEAFAFLHVQQRAVKTAALTRLARRDSPVIQPLDITLCALCGLGGYMKSGFENLSLRNKKRPRSLPKPLILNFQY